MSGCSICVHDLYAEALTEYQTSLDALRSALHARGVSETDWPAHIQHNSGSIKRVVNPTLSAFEQMEKMLAAKRVERGKKEEEGRGIETSVGG